MLPGVPFPDAFAAPFVQALLFETDQAADIKKVEKLNNAFFLAMSTKSLDSLESFAASADLASLAAPSSRGVPTRK